VSELPPSSVGAEEARDIADQVLRGRAYRQANQPPSLQERFFDWIGERFSDLFSALSSSGGRGIMAWLVIAVFGGAVLFLVSRLLRTWGPLPARIAEPDPIIDIEAGYTADQWMKQAQELEASGDWRGGIRCRHRSLITTLIDRNIVTVRPGQTAGEIQQILAVERPATAQAMQEATWLFKDTWYGWVMPEMKHRDRFVELADVVLEQSAVVPA